MSEAEDIRAVVGNNDFQNIIEEESGRSSSVDYLDTYEDIPKEAVRESPEETKEELFEEEKEKEAFAENEIKPIETEKKEATQAAATNTVDDDVARREESATRIGTATGTIVDGRKQNAPVGEWNSLPLLVERLRAALELSLGGRRDDEPPASLLEDSGVDSEEDFRIRSSMEQGGGKEAELKKDLKFLEDLLLSDIQTALSRLRETLERIDVATLAKHGAASDPTSKLQLLRLVSSLLSRLQVPEKSVAEKVTVLPSTPSSRRRRGTRHTIGVSAEELAEARKWLEEERNSLPAEETPPIFNRQQSKEQNSSATGHSVIVDRKPEEIRDKCIKDAINQRQLLEDKNKEIRDSCAFRGIQQVDVADDKGSEESSMYQARYRANNYQERENSGESIEDCEERSRVSKLAAVLRQRAELAASGGGKCGGGNKFSAKKSKIKRANTIDIPSYLKLQAGNLGHESTGCVSLRKPISVGDKSFNSASVVVPSFQPRTENDRKFLALINKNNETPAAAPVVPFKTFGQVKTMDASSLANENWNSRFSNIKTAFDKPTAVEERENKTSLKARANKMFPAAGQTQIHSDSSTNYVPQVPKTDTSTGFRHAPSSPFRKIEKSVPATPSKVPPTYHWPKNAPTPTSTLKEKAKMMFGRENAQPSSKSFRADLEKPSFPRPPWIEHERNENRANGTVTENGKLDYRSFCKQFAPFVGKTSSMESKQLEEHRQRELGHRDGIPGVVDGKISFKMVPDKRVQTQQHPPIERRGSKEKFEEVKSAKELGYSYPEATLRGSSSVAVQTGVNDDNQGEERSFRVAPRTTKEQNLVCSNAAVQTSGELGGPVISVSGEESSKESRPTLHEHLEFRETSEDRQTLVLDHNENYRTVPGGSEFGGAAMESGARQAPSDQGFREPVRFQGAQSRQKQSGNLVESYPLEDTVNNQHCPSTFVPSTTSNCNRPEEVSNTSSQKAAEWPVEGSTFVDDQNIQNQDISPEIGVVTRYTCAIATVASVDSPEPRSEEIPIDSRASSTPSPSQLSWSRSRPPTSETVTSEDEIRRHNLLQQSLVRRLQNEITSLNDPPQNYQTSNYGQHLTVGQSQPNSSSQSPCSLQSYQQQTYGQSASVIQDHQQPSYDQSPNLIKSYQGYKSANAAEIHQQQSYGHPSSMAASHRQQNYSQTGTAIQMHQQQMSRRTPSPVHQQIDYSQPANFDHPSAPLSSRFGKFLMPVPQKQPDPPRTHSPVPVPANRVGTLRDAYEQAPNTPAKSINKERSPVPNGVTPIDSSDEYLVSCANKPSRSIVLSKSESWHQLALSNSCSRSPKVNVLASPSAVPRNTSHPKPPKPRSPSSQKLRSKQYEASSMADSVKKMEDKIRQYFDQPVECAESKDSTKQRRSPRFGSKGMVSLSRSRTMPGIPDEKMRLLIPAPQQVPLLNVNTADVDKVFDDLFEEATRTDKQ